VTHHLAVAPGVTLWPLRLDPAEQTALLDDVLAGVARAPFFDPTMPRTGKKFSVRMTNFGPLGWVSDAAKGYRYEETHPATGEPWPPIPNGLLRLWEESTRYGAPPEACLVNLYGPSARMGLHRDLDEAAVDAPVLSVSLGDSGYFRFGTANLKGETRRLKLNSGDVLVFGGPARLMYHGIDRILPGSSTLVPGGGRINLTLRRVTWPGPNPNPNKEALTRGLIRASNAP
jgi:alkylated DNA repair protein (DNA oxidative demethylase)